MGACGFDNALGLALDPVNENERKKKEYCNGNGGISQVMPFHHEESSCRLQWLTLREGSRRSLEVKSSAREIILMQVCTLTYLCQYAQSARDLTSQPTTGTHMLRWQLAHRQHRAGVSVRHRHAPQYSVHRPTCQIQKGVVQEPRHGSQAVLCDASISGVPERPPSPACCVGATTFVCTEYSVPPPVISCSTYYLLKYLVGITK